MGIRFEQLCGLVEREAPLFLQASWDNSGGMVYAHDDVKNVLVCLDITPEVLEYARINGYDTILSHHPLLFSPLSKVYASDYTGGMLFTAIRCGINIYSAHTSYDLYEKGLNHAMAEKLGLTDVKPLNACFPDGGEYCGAFGLFPEAIKLTDFLKLLKEILKVPMLRYSGNREHIKSVVYTGGSGGDYLSAALRLRADAFVTGEVRHHQYFHNGQILLVEAGHFDTEKHFSELMANSLQKYADALKCNLRVCTCEIERRPYFFH